MRVEIFALMGVHKELQKCTENFAHQMNKEKRGGGKKKE